MSTEKSVILEAPALPSSAPPKDPKEQMQDFLDGLLDWDRHGDAMSFSYNQIVGIPRNKFIIWWWVLSPGLHAMNEMVQ